MPKTVVLERLLVDPSGSSDSRRHSLKHQRIYIFPTMQGWVYGMMLVVMLFGAINYSNSMAFMLCFLLTGLGLVCILHTYRNLAGLIISSKKPAAVFAGQQALFPIQLDNRLGTQRFSIQLERKERVKRQFINKRKSVNENNTGVSVSIMAGKQKVTHYPCQADKRGLLQLKRLKISTCFPLGIFRAWSYFEPEAFCLVYPLSQGQKQIPLTVFDDENADSGKQSGMDDFAGFRKYRAGDPVSQIAWKSFAREQGLFVKQFSGNGVQIIMLSWKFVEHLGDIETGLSQLCYWIILADKAAMYYGLEIPKTLIEPSSGTHHREACLTALALYGQKNEAR